MTAALPFETRFAAALRAPAPGDPPFPLDALASRLAASLRALEPRLLRNATSAGPLPASDAASRLCGEAIPHGRFKTRRVAAAAAALLCATALGAWSAGVFKPAPLHRRIPSISVRDAAFPELLDALDAELARLDPDAEAAVSFRFELPEGRTPDDLPRIPRFYAGNCDVLGILHTAASIVGLDLRVETNTVVFFPKPEQAPPPPEGAVRFYGNEWNRDPATRPPVLETREWTLPDPPPGPAAARPRTSREWKKWFSERGVDWPYGSSLAYNEALGLLRIENAPEQLELAEAILAPFLHAESAEGAEFESHAETAETAEPESHAGSAESESHAKSAETAEP